MKRGYPRPSIYIEKTSTAQDTPGVSWGDKWDDRKYPVPYTAMDNSIAELNPDRARECIDDKICSVCGDMVKEDLVGLALVNDETTDDALRRYWEEYGWVTVEAGPFHMVCLTLAFRMCPHLVETDRFMPGVGLWEDVQPLMLRWYSDTNTDGGIVKS